MDSNSIVFQADKIRLSGPRVDGSYSVSFDVGEYEQPKIARVVAIPQQTVVKVTVETDG